MAQRAAGHHFDFWGRCSLDTCQVRLTDLISRRAEWVIGQPGIAHYGCLTETEKNELEAIYQGMCDATDQIAASRGR